MRTIPPSSEDNMAKNGTKEKTLFCPICNFWLYEIVNDQHRL
jgi:hypothetical protein